MWPFTNRKKKEVPPPPTVNDLAIVLKTPELEGLAREYHHLCVYTSKKKVKMQEEARREFFDTFFNTYPWCTLARLQWKYSQNRGTIYWVEVLKMTDLTDINDTPQAFMCKNLSTELKMYTGSF